MVSLGNGTSQWSFILTFAVLLRILSDFLIKWDFCFTISYGQVLMGRSSVFHIN